MFRVNSQEGNIVNQVCKTYLNLKSCLCVCLEKQFGKFCFVAIRLPHQEPERAEVGKQASDFRHRRGHTHGAQSGDLSASKAEGTREGA